MVELLSHLRSLERSAYADFQRSVKLKDAFLIADSMERLNRIDWRILQVERESRERSRVEKDEYKCLNCGKSLGEHGCLDCEI